MPEKQLSHSKLTSTPEMTVPSGAQNTVTSSGPSGSVVVYGDGPFQIWFVYQTSGTSTTILNYSIDGGPFQPMKPGTYPDLKAQQYINFQWQVDSERVILLVWVFISGC